MQKREFGNLVRKRGLLFSNQEHNESSQTVRQPNKNVGGQGLTSKRTFYSDLKVMCMSLVLADSVVFTVYFVVSLAVLENSFKTRL